MPVKNTQETGLQYESLYAQNVCGHDHSHSSSHLAAIQGISQLPDMDQARGNIR